MYYFTPSKHWTGFIWWVFFSSQTGRELLSLWGTRLKVILSVEFNLSAWPRDSLGAGFNEAANKSTFNMVLMWPLSCFDSQSFWVPNSRVWSPSVSHQHQFNRLGWPGATKLLIHTENTGIFILPPTACIAHSTQTHPRSLLTLLRSLRGFPEAGLWQSPVPACVGTKGFPLQHRDSGHKQLPASIFASNKNTL